MAMTVILADRDDDETRRLLYRKMVIARATRLAGHRVDYETAIAVVKHKAPHLYNGRDNIPKREPFALLRELYLRLRCVLRMSKEWA